MLSRTGTAAAVLALLAACTPPPPAPWGGYAEGEPLRIAAPVAGRLVELPAGEGSQVAQGALLFRLDATPGRDAEAEAAARTEAAALQARDSATGRRPTELAVLEAQLASARAQARVARNDSLRKQQLAAQGFVSSAQVDDAAQQLRAAEARVAEAQAQLAAAQLPGREAQRGAAQQLAQAAAQQQAQAAWRVQQAAQHAPQAGLLQTVYRRPGEWVGAGEPVLALLPPAARKAVFFVPEAQRGRLAPGLAVRLACDGCGAPIAARITRIAEQVEYTPPVLYSQTQRATLVFRAEAHPEREADALRLQPGQPLDVQATDD